MELIKDLTAGQRAFLVSYFPSIFDEDAGFADANEETFIDELSATEFSDGDAVHGRLVNIAKALQSKNMLREVIADPADSGYFLTVRFNEATARSIFALVQETKRDGTFYDLAKLPLPGSSMLR
jgi:hypothetical protein